jgi:excisionase family DNA binding protein
MEIQTHDRWLSVQEIASHLGVSKETIYRYLESKKIPAYKVGKQWKFSISEINEWVRSGQAEDC